MMHVISPKIEKNCPDHVKRPPEDHDTARKIDASGTMDISNLDIYDDNGDGEDDADSIKYLKTRILFEGLVKMQVTGELPVCVVILEQLFHEVRCIEIAACLIVPNGTQSCHKLNALSSRHLFVSPDKLFAKIDKNEVRIRVALNTARGLCDDGSEAANIDSQKNTSTQKDLEQQYTYDLAVQYILNRLDVALCDIESKTFEIVLLPKSDRETVRVGRRLKRMLDVQIDRPAGLHTEIDWPDCSVLWTMAVYEQVNAGDRSAASRSPCLTPRDCSTSVSPVTVTKIDADSLVADLPGANSAGNIIAADHSNLPYEGCNVSRLVNADAFPSILVSADAVPGSAASSEPNSNFTSRRPSSEAVSQIFSEATEALKRKALQASEERESIVQTRRNWMTAIRRVIRRMHVDRLSDYLHKVLPQMSSTPSAATSAGAPSDTNVPSCLHSRNSSVSLSSPCESRGDPADLILDEKPIPESRPRKKPAPYVKKNSFVLCCKPHDTSGCIVPSTDSEKVVVVKSRIVPDSERSGGMSLSDSTADSDTAAVSKNAKTLRPERSVHSITRAASAALDVDDGSDNFSSKEKTAMSTSPSGVIDMRRARSFTGVDLPSEHNRRKDRANSAANTSPAVKQRAHLAARMGTEQESTESAPQPPHSLPRPFKVTAVPVRLHFSDGFISQAHAPAPAQIHSELHCRPSRDAQSAEMSRNRRSSSGTDSSVNISASSFEADFVPGASSSSSFLSSTSTSASASMSTSVTVSADYDNILRPRSESSLVEIALADWDSDTGISLRSFQLSSKTSGSVCDTDTDSVSPLIATTATCNSLLSPPSTLSSVSGSTDGDDQSSDCSTVDDVKRRRSLTTTLTAARELLCIEQESSDTSTNTSGSAPALDHNLSISGPMPHPYLLKMMYSDKVMAALAASSSEDSVSRKLKSNN